LPTTPEELTTEGGLDVAGQRAVLPERIARLKGAGIVVSLFVEPSPEQIKASRDAGADFVEIHTGHYADAQSRLHRAEALERIRRAVTYGRELGLQVNAGHGLDYRNVKAIAALPGVAELNIGHGIIARALFTGLGEAVREMKRTLNDPALRRTAPLGSAAGAATDTSHPR